MSLHELVEFGPWIATSFALISVARMAVKRGFAFSMRLEVGGKPPVEKGGEA